MKYLCLLFFIYAVQANDPELNENLNHVPESPVILATVRDLNSGLPKCVGSFVAPDTLVTTARCLFCERDCNLEVYVNEKEAGAAKIYKIKSMQMHEEFDMDPHRNDIGLIYLAENVSDTALVELLALKHDPTQFTAFSFTGKIIDEFYALEPQNVKVLTNAKCTFALQNYIPETQVCSFSNNRYYFKEQDQGSPLMYSVDGKMYLLGIYATGDFESDQGAKIAVYQGIGPYLEWIEHFAKNKASAPKCRPRSVTGELYNKKE